MSKEELEVDQWNRLVPVGASVEVTKDSGQVIETKTRSEAWLLGGHTPVVQVEGIRGGYALHRVRTLKGQTPGETNGR